MIGEPPPYRQGSHFTLVNIQPSATLLLIIVILLILLELSRYKWILKWFTSRKTSGKTLKPRVMKPRTEKDCPHCQKALASGTPISSTWTHMPQPWNEKKSKRGRKKTIGTQHQFCSKPDCDYYLPKSKSGTWSHTSIHFSLNITIREILWAKNIRDKHKGKIFPGRL